MMNSNPFLKRLMKAKTEDVVHSSAYAQAQNREGIGVASTRGFGERMRMEKNRTSVKGYGDSEVVNLSLENAPKAKRYDPSKDMKYRGSRGREERVATNRAMVASGTSPAAAAPKPKTPLPWNNPGISR